eukprot:9090998-Alexandrium_andersonii.AAC.1
MRVDRSRSLPALSLSFSPCVRCGTYSACKLRCTCAVYGKGEGPESPQQEGDPEKLRAASAETVAGRSMWSCGLRLGVKHAPAIAMAADVG